MKELFTKSFIRALIITVISALIIAGAVYAYETLWSGKADITIEPPTAEGQGELEITGVEALSNGIWNDATDTWTVSIARGEEAQIWVHLKNVGADAATVVGYINGSSERQAYVGSGVYMTWSPWSALTIAADASGVIKFHLVAEADAEPGTLSEVQLEIRQQ